MLARSLPAQIATTTIVPVWLLGLALTDTGTAPSTDVCESKDHRVRQVMRESLPSIWLASAPMTLVDFDQAGKAGRA